MRPIIWLTIVGVLWPLVVAAGPSRTSREAPREGWVLGLAFGSASSDVTVEDAGLSATSGWIGGGRVIRGRVGFFARPNLLLTGEYGVWRRAEAGSDSTAAASSDAGWTAPTDRYLGAGVLSAHLYPVDRGFFLKAGAGYGRIAATVEQDGVSIEQDAWGFLMLMGAGWDVSIAHDISMSLAADVGRIDGGSAVGGNFLHLTATFQLHLPTGLPTRWF